MTLSTRSGIVDRLVIGIVFGRDIGVELRLELELELELGVKLEEDEKDDELDIVVCAFCRMPDSDIRRKVLDNNLSYSTNIKLDASSDLKIQSN